MFQTGEKILEGDNMYIQFRNKLSVFAGSENLIIFHEYNEDIFMEIDYNVKKTNISAP